MLRIQTSYKQTKERQQVHNRNTTQDRTDGKTTNNKQQTQTCNYLQTKNESKTRTTNNQTPRTSNLVIWKVQTVLQKEECYERRGCCLQSENTNIKLNKREITTNNTCSTQTQHKTTYGKKMTTNNK